VIYLGKLCFYLLTPRLSPTSFSCDHNNGYCCHTTGATNSLLSVFSIVSGHIWALGYAGDNLPTLIKSRLDLLEEQGRCYTSTVQCLNCPIDFVLDIVDLGERGIAGILTRWTNLGAGLHPADPKWRRHIGKSLPREVTYEPHPLGSIRSSFENQTAIAFNEFTARNMYNLLSKRERKRITRREDEFIWKLVYDDPHRWSLEHAKQGLEWDLVRIFSNLVK
jgi:hypothetical protein